MWLLVRYLLRKRQGMALQACLHAAESTSGGGNASSFSEERWQEKRQVANNLKLRKRIQKRQASGPRRLRGLQRHAGT